MAPVVIPALAPSLDRSLKSDRSLCPVRALRYYLDRTSDIRQNKELVFVSFKKGFDKDILRATISSWIKQSLKSDRSLCPVRALRYYLDRTSDFRQKKELVFVTFKKGFDKDISPATISLWIKQTVIICYELSDQEALILHQVKAHDVRAIAASKAFQSGVSLEQILSACHWKPSHNFI